MAQTNDYLTRILEAAESHTAFVSRVMPQVDIPEPKGESLSFVYNFYTINEMEPGRSVSTEVGSTGNTYVGSRSYRILDTTTSDEAASGYFVNETEKFPMYNKVSWNEVTLDNPPLDQSMIDSVASQLEDIWHLAEHEGSFGSGVYTGLITPTINIYEVERVLYDEWHMSMFVTDWVAPLAGEHGARSITGMTDILDAYSKVSDLYALLGSIAESGLGAGVSSLELPEITKQLVSIFSNYQVSDYDVDPTGTGATDDMVAYAFASQNNIQFSSSIYNSVYHDVVRKGCTNMLSWYRPSFTANLAAANAIQATGGIETGVTHGMFPVVNPVSIIFPEDTTASTAASADDQVAASVVGYIVEKYTASSATVGTRNAGGDDFSTVLISPYADGTSLTDSNVVYGRAYNYAIRTVILIQVPIINRSALGPDSDQAGYAYVLAMSRPNYTNAAYAIDATPPPPPSNLDFIYNYSDNSLLVYWEMPTNPQEDIIAFQVFRREALDEPYELIAEYDWDESFIPYPRSETSINPKVQEYNAGSPRVSCIDYDFTKDSTYHYAICSVDARRLSSGYSSQFEVSFNRFKNKINVKKVSFPGAPKPYPNLYITADTFADSIKTSEYDTFFVFFNPDFYYVSDSGSDLNFISTGEKPTYHMNVLNTDMQDMETINIKIKDTGGAFGALKPS
jgi:hypothetical protein